MADLPLALALSSVLAAAVDGDARPGLLSAACAHARPDAPPGPATTSAPARRPLAA